MTTDTTRQDVSATVTERELCSQPEMWERVLAEPQRTFDLLPDPDERLAVLGCGTSYYIGEAYARVRERAGLGATRALKSRR
jgi:fructoselysine-6-P-deglycase FrlB-like protein